jgi:hypothetical protein
MARLAHIELFGQHGQPGDPLDKVGWVLVLLIIWRLIGGC